MGLGAFTTAGSYGRVLGLGGFVMGLAQCIYILSFMNIHAGHTLCIDTRTVCDKCECNSYVVHCEEDVLNMTV